MMFIIGWLGGSVAIAALASSRGRNGGAWFFLALLVSPILSGLLLFVLPRLRPSYAQIAAFAAVEATPANSHARQLLEAELARWQPRPPVNYKPLSNTAQNGICAVALSIVGALAVLMIVGMMTARAHADTAPITAFECYQDQGKQTHDQVKFVRFAIGLTTVRMINDRGQTFVFPISKLVRSVDSNGPYVAWVEFTDRSGRTRTINNGDNASVISHTAYYYGAPDQTWIYQCIGGATLGRSAPARWSRHLQIFG